jgi:hypothetical protein
MRQMLVSLMLAATLGMSACGGLAKTSYVKASDAALGRVVVYRNGIAYYERRARILGEKLTLKVPADKVDDFLKSLTVADAATGRALPGSFPSGNVGYSGMIDMSIPLGLGGPRDVILTYVTEAPAWKPSYRLVLGEAGKVNLQGWAIVDNTSGEDWEAVRVGVGSSSALSFRFDLHSVRLVHRETLSSHDTFAKAPPVGGSVVRDVPAGEELVLGSLADKDIPRPAGHPDTSSERWRDEAGAYGSAGAGKHGITGSGGGGGGEARVLAQADMPRLRHARKSGGGHSPAAEPTVSAQAAARVARKEAAVDDSRVQALADQLRNRRGKILIEGYAEPNEPDAEAHALDRANNLRNQLIMKGVAPAQVAAVSRGVQVGQRAGVRLVEQTTPAAEAEKGRPEREQGGTPIGESHFESKSAMTVGRGSSAMVSIVHTDAQGDVVYLYDAESPAGSARFAFKSVRFRNPTGSTLETGPVTVYGEGRFIGEGLTESIPPRQTAVIPFALDRQVVVDRDGSSADRISQLVKLHRGVLTAEVQHVRLTRLKVTSRLHTAVTLLVRHTVRKGWQLTRAPKTAEQLGEARLFEVLLAAGQTRTLEIEEATPMVRTLDLRTPVGIDLVRVYLATPKADKAFSAAIEKVLKHHAEMSQHQESIESLRQRGDEYRQRLDELHFQILSLQAVKAKGTLMGHLQTKMKEISQKVQENTIAIVDHQEKLMVARVRFHDGLAELTLAKPEKSAIAAK